MLNIQEELNIRVLVYNKFDSYSYLNHTLACVAGSSERVFAFTPQQDVSFVLSGLAEGKLNYGLIQEFGHIRTLKNHFILRQS